MEQKSGMRASFHLLIGLFLAVISTHASHAEGLLAKDLLGNKALGSGHRPEAIGFYSKGCLAGGVQLDENGPTWQAMRLSRNRNWGHPMLLEYIADLSSRVALDLPGWKGLYVGDMNQPRGGPMKTGHASHQSGLDVDIWMLPASRLDLTRKEREEISSISIRSKDQRTVNQNWTDAHAKLLELAARDARVDRIFVTPPAKIELCKTAKSSDRDWLQKIRPYWGHHYHFHVRLKCPEGSKRCVSQSPSVAELSKGGDGCDSSLNWWVTTALIPPDPNQPKPKPKRHPREYTMDDLPRACRAVLRAE